MMEEKALACIQKFNMIQEGNNVLAALSGGADSMALFHFLVSRRAQLGIRLAAAHFDHGLRGAASRADADFVRAVCARYAVPLYCQEGAMAEKPRPKGLGTEEWARQLRYAFFARLAEEHNAKIALAHTLSDNAETVLFRLARGTGPRGLAGIPPVRGPYIRPLLECSRAEIEAYCRQNSLVYCSDETNSDNRYSRNRLRNRVLPQLEEAHPGAAHSVARLAGDMRALDEWLAGQAQALLEAARETGWHGGVGYRAAVLLAAPQPLRLKALAMLAGPRADRAALARLETVLAGGCGQVDLPGEKQASLQKNVLYVEQKFEDLGPFCYEIPFKEGVFHLPGGYVLRAERAQEGAKQPSCKKKTQKGLLFVADYARMSNCGLLRTRRPQDVFAPKGRNGSKTLKKWMNEAAVPRSLRGKLPLLADGNRVLWVYGQPFCQALQPSENTAEWLLVHCGE